MKAISISHLLTLHTKTKGKTRYLLGAKPDPHADSSEVRYADCSGWIRWVIARCTGTAIPEGSCNQLEYIKQLRLHEIEHYHHVAFAKSDPNRLFIAFMPRRGKHYGHVWLVYMGRTLECCSSSNVSSREWHEVTTYHKDLRCFELPCSP